MDSLSWRPLLEPVNGLRLDCPEPLLERERLGCADAVLRLDTSLLERPETRVDFSLDPKQHLTGSIREVAFAGGRLAVRPGVGLAARAGGALAVDA